MSFDQWMALVNGWLVKLCGMDSDMLPDYTYFKAYKARKTPDAAARAALRYAKTCF